MELFNYFLCLLDCLWLWVGFYLVFKKDMRSYSLNIITILFISFISYYLTNFVYFNSLVIEAMNIALLFLFLCICFKRNTITSLVYYLILTCGTLLVILIIFLFIDFFNYEFTTNDILISLIFHSFTLLFTIICSRWFKYKIGTYPEYMIQEIMYVLLLPSFILLILFELYFELYTSFLFLILLLSTAITFILLFRQTQKLMNYTLKLTNQYYVEKLLNDTTAYVNQVEQSNSQIKTMKHDFNNHLIAIQKLNDEENHSELNNYLNSLVNSINTNTYNYSNNIFIDAILNAKVKENPIINFHLDIVIGDTLFIKNIEITSLLSNILDNAIQEVNHNDIRNKTITVTVKASNDILIIRCKNTLTKIKTLQTEKQNKIDHGIGLNIIKQIVSKYNGELRITQDCFFTIEIILTNTTK